MIDSTPRWPDLSLTPTVAPGETRGIVEAMKKVLMFAAAAEAATGLALVIDPSLVGQLLLGAELAGIAIPVARVAGMALIGLSLACWPGPPALGIAIYSGLVTLYLAFLGFVGGWGGIMLWPAVALHLVLTVLLTWVTASDGDAKTKKNSP